MNDIVTIESLAHGGAAVARTERRVVFVKGAAPGDTVRIRRTQEHAGYDEAEVVELLAPGDDRVEPPCAIADVCGGCSWQQVSYEAQLAAKRAAVVDALTRIGGLVDPPVEPTVASPRRFGYRNRIRLRFDGRRLGFYRAKTNSLVPVADCLIAEDTIRESLRAVERFVASLSTRVLRVEIAARGTLAGIVLLLNSQGRLRRSDGHTIRAFLADDENTITGVFLWGRGWKRSWGDTRRVHEIDHAGTTIAVEGGGFAQVNSEANRILVAAVADAACAGRTSSVIELFAGSGNFTTALAGRGLHVTAVESDGEAVESAKRTLRERQRQADAEAPRPIDAPRFRAPRCIEADVRRFVEDHRGETPDVVVVDPPRSGLAEIAPTLASWRAPRLVYVSCNTPTLARDVATFAQAGYRLESALPMDLFPQTFHVETLCILELT